MAQILMDVSKIGGTIQTQYSGVVVPDEDGLVSVDSMDAISLLAAGAAYPVLNPQDMAKAVEKRNEDEKKRLELIAKSEQERLEREGLVPEVKDEKDEHETVRAGSGPVRATAAATQHPAERR